MQLEIERQALRKETDAHSKERLKQLEGELARLREESSAIKARWQVEKDAIARIRKSKEAIEQLKAEEQRLERAGELAGVAEIRYGKLAAAKRELTAAQTKSRRTAKGRPHAEGRSGRRGHRQAGRQVDRHSRRPLARRRSPETGAHGRAPAPARGRARTTPSYAWPMPSAATAPASSDPQPPHRLVHFPRPHRRRQNGTGARARRISVRRRARP